MRSAAFGDRALRLAQTAVAGQAFDRVDFLAGEIGEQDQATVDRAEAAACAIGGNQQGRAGAAFALRAALLGAGQAAAAEIVEERGMDRKTLHTDRPAIEQKIHQVPQTGSLRGHGTALTGPPES